MAIDEIFQLPLGIWVNVYFCNVSPFFVVLGGSFHLALVRYQVQWEWTEEILLDIGKLCRSTCWICFGSLLHGRRGYIWFRLCFTVLGLFFVGEFSECISEATKLDSL